MNATDQKKPCFIASSTGTTRSFLLIWQNEGKSLPYQLRLLFASRPELMGKVLGIMYRAIAMYLIKKAGLTRKAAQSGAVTLVQRFGSALNLNPNAARSKVALIAVTPSRSLPALKTLWLSS